MGATAACLAASLFSMTLQAAPPPAGAPTPGQVQSTLPQQSMPKPPVSPAAISSPASNAPGVAPGGPTFKVSSFTLEGNSVIPTAELQAQIAGYIGQTLTLAQLYDVADVLTRYYRAKGYGLAYVAPPAQKISGGVVRLEVVEGRVGDINIQGNSRTRTGVLQARAASVRSGEVYTNAAAERAVLLMNDLPGVQAHAVLSPGTTFGTSDVLFNIDETRSTGDISVDDYGRNVIGRWRVNADYAINDLTGSGDQLAAGVTHSDGNLLNFGKLSYLVPVAPAGAMLNTSFNRAEYHGVFSNGSGEIPFSGSTQNAVLNWQYPTVRSAARSIYWGLGLNYDNSRSQTRDPTTGKTTTDSLTTNILLLQLSSFYTRQYQDQSVFSVAATFWTNGRHYDHGMGLNNVSRERARGEVDTTWQKPLAGEWSFIGQANASYSVNTLTDADKFNLGGPNSVLGYQSAEERGDSGYFLSGEVQRQFSPGPGWPMAWGVFLDNGKVWDKGGTLGVSGDSSRGLSSAGLDLQLLPSAERLNARLQWAYAIGRRPTDGAGGGHIWLTLGMAF